MENASSSFVLQKIKSFDSARLAFEKNSAIILYGLTVLYVSACGVCSIYGLLPALIILSGIAQGVFGSLELKINRAVCVPVDNEALSTATLIC